MIERGRYEGGRVMTASAILTGWQVIHTLTQADDVIMASRTGHRIQITGIMIEDATTESTG